MRSDKLRKVIAEESRREEFEDSYIEVEVETTCVLYDLALIIQA
jgi:hypothetical protein